LVPRSGSNTVMRVDLVAEQLDPDRGLVFVRREDVDDVAAGPERAAVEVLVVALVLDLDQLRRMSWRFDGAALLEQQQHALVGFAREPRP
jgi:hypothetical protein